MANFSNELKKAMHEKGHCVATLSIEACMNVKTVASVINFDGSSLYRDVVEVCHVLGLNISIAKLGDK